MVCATSSHSFMSASRSARRASSSAVTRAVSSTFTKFDSVGFVVGDLRLELRDLFLDRAPPLLHLPQLDRDSAACRRAPSTTGAAAGAATADVFASSGSGSGAPPALRHW